MNAIDIALAQAKARAADARQALGYAEPTPATLAEALRHVTVAIEHLCRAGELAERRTQQRIEGGSE